jgi:hypothetical protein
MGMKNWRRKQQDREQWWTVLERLKSTKECNVRRKRKSSRRKKKKKKKKKKLH